MALNLRLPPDLDLRLRKAAADRYMSLNTLIVQALAESRYLVGVEVPQVAREPGKLFSEAEALAIAKSPAVRAPVPPVARVQAYADTGGIPPQSAVVGAPVAPAKPSKAETRAYMQQKRLSRRG